MNAVLLLLSLSSTPPSTPAPPGATGLKRLDRSAVAETPRAIPGIHPSSGAEPIEDGRQVIGPDGRKRIVPGAKVRNPEGVDYGEAFARFGVCTATHVGRGLFLTAGHCISEEPGFRGFRSAPCPSPLTLFDGRKLGCRIVTFAFDEHRDHALVQVDDASAVAELPAFPVDYTFDWSRVREREVRLYGLSKGILRVNDSCTARYDRRRRRILHDCDTEGGDSGAALIDRRTQHIIAVHGGALPNVNYGWPIAHVPWAETLCVALGASARLPILPGGAPVRLRVSTSKMEGDFRRLVIALDGRLDNRDLALKVQAPRVDIEVPPQQIRWLSPTRWRWDDVFILDEDGRGPWSAAVWSTADPKTPRRGYVTGKIWVCP
ncbi:MAG: trypsin-like peptidase domain-containing protein [Deltaproteobacteria bacterium]